MTTALRRDRPQTNLSRNGPWAPHVIAAELAGLAPLGDDPWCPDLANGVCCHCEKAAEPDFLLCRACIGRLDDEGAGRGGGKRRRKGLASGIRASLRRAYL